MSMRERYASAIAAGVIGVATIYGGSVGVAAENDGGSVDAVIDNIVVTARRAEETQQSVPVALSIFSGDNLEQRGALDISALDQSTPNIFLTSSSVGSGVKSAPIVFLRGIGQGDFIITTDPGVGIYLDGVYVGRNLGALFDFVDVERVEVLRGPQGTLFGRNTIGGAISLISKKPSENFHGRISGEIGEDNLYRTELMLNIPISDKIRTRLSGFLRHQDGYVDALQYDDLKLGEDNVWGLRGQIAIDLTERIAIDISADYSRRDETPAANVPINLGNIQGETSGPAPGSFGFAYNAAFSGDPGCLAPTGPFENPNCFGPVQLPGDPFATNSVYTDRDGNQIVPEQEMEVWGVHLTVTADLGFGELKSISAYRALDSSFFQDLDFSPFVIFHNNHPEFSQDQFSQEVQLLGSLFNDRVDYVFGAYYFREDGIEFIDLPGLPGLGAFPQSGRWQLIERDITNRSFAAFGQVNVHITERLTLTAGLRYTDDKKNLTFTQVLENIGVTNGPSSGQQRAKEWTPMVTLAYQVTDNALLYTTFSQGFRSGGFPGRFLGALPDPLPFFDPEFVDSYEFGLKSDWFDSRLRVNIAGFITEYTDRQTAAVVPISGFPQTTTDNLAGSRISGVELETVGLITDNFQIDLAVGYLNAKITDLVGGFLISTPFLITEDSNPALTPEWTFALGATRTVPIGDVGLLTARVDWSYKDDFFFRTENAPDTFQNGYHIVNSMLTYAHEDNGWEVSVGVRNLTDEAYFESSTFFPILPGSFGSISRPRTVFGRVTYRFGEE